MTTLARITAFTHRGHARADNEDTIVVGDWVSVIDMPAPEQTQHDLTAPLIIAVADGMGGHNAGEVASRYAARRLAGEPERLIDPRGAAETLQEIDAELYRAMTADDDLLGMGTTVVGLVLAPRLIWFNVGDSRLYWDRSDHLLQLSIDDTPDGPRSGVITQSLGGTLLPRQISPHVGEAELHAPQRFLLCSDGLTDMLDDEIIAECMRLGDVQATVQLFERAMDAGGRDNISIVLVSVERA